MRKCPAFLAGPRLAAPRGITTHPGARVSSFSTYLLGFVIFTAGLALGAYLLDVPPLWILAGVIMLIGIGVLTATSRTKTRDLPPPGRGGYGTGPGTGHPPAGPTGPGTPPPPTTPPTNRPPGSY